MISKQAEDTTCKYALSAGGKYMSPWSPAKGITAETEEIDRVAISSLRIVLKHHNNTLH